MSGSRTCCWPGAWTRPGSGFRLRPPRLFQRENFRGAAGAERLLPRTSGAGRGPLRRVAPGRGFDIAALRSHPRSFFRPRRIPTKLERTSTTCCPEAATRSAGSMPCAGPRSWTRRQRKKPSPAFPLAYREANGKALELLSRFNRSLRAGRVDYVFDRNDVPLAYYDLKRRASRALVPGIDFSAFEAQFKKGARRFRLTLDSGLQRKIDRLFQGYARDPGPSGPAGERRRRRLFQAQVPEAPSMPLSASCSSPDPSSSSFPFWPTCAVAGTASSPWNARACWPWRARSFTTWKSTGRCGTFPRPWPARAMSASPAWAGRSAVPA